ncbi:MAG: type II secretion system protein [Phycisphaerae bacterium]
MREGVHPQSIKTVFIMGGRKKQGFTLIELLVVLAIIGLLLAILMPAMSAGRNVAMDLKCKANLRIIAQRFIDFADSSGAALRGDSEHFGNRFLIEDFQESIYEIDEFWSDYGGAERVAMPRVEQPLICPSGPPHLERTKGFPCSSGAIGPFRNVSIGFNMRLDTRTRDDLPLPYPATAYLTGNILQFPAVPLAFDVDGQEAFEDDRLPYYSAPPILDDKYIDFYEDGRFWFPSFRHRDGLNVAFVGGHVLASSDPVMEPWWRWDFQPEP